MTKQSTINMDKIRNKINAIGEDLKSQYVERDDIIDNMIRAICSAQHAILIGEAGIAKSAVTESFLARIDGAFYFKRLLRKDTCPDEVLGSMSLKLLAEDEFKRVLTPKNGWKTKRVGNIQSAHIATLDEAFKCNSTVLNGMLDIMNERKFQNGDDEVNCRLVSAFLLSNEKPQSDDLSAFWDRCVVRMIVKDIQEDTSFLEFLNAKTGNGSHQDSGITITIDELLLAVEDVKNVAIKPDFNEMVTQLRRSLHEIGIRPSPRRFSFILNYLKAVAWLDGRAEVESDDLMSLTDCLWETEDDIPKISGIVGNLASPDLGKIIELLDAAKSVYGLTKKQNPDAADLLEANTSLKNAKKHIEEIKKRSASKKVKAKASSACKQIKKWHQEMLQKLGMDVDI